MIATASVMAPRSLQLVPDRHSSRLLPWLFALLIYLAGLGMIGLILLGQALSSAEASLAARLTVQLPADVSNARLDTVLALLRQTQGVNAVHLLDSAETARLLQPWLGQAAPLEQLPVPRLIDVTSERGGLDVAALRGQLNSIVPTARLEDHRTSPPGLPAAAHRIEVLLGAAIVVALLLLAVLAGSAGVRTLVGERSQVALLHVLGARDSDIAANIALRTLRLGLAGGVVGAIVVALTVLALTGTAPMLPLAVIGLADWRIWLVLILLVPLAGLIPMAGAWIAASRRLADMD